MAFRDIVKRHIDHKKRVALMAIGLFALCASAQDSVQQKKGILHGIYRFVKEFSRVDTNYVEPQHYNFQLMMQNTNTYEFYEIANKNNQSILFAPKPSIKIGPYFGWRWIFLGYTLDISHVHHADNKQDFNISLYSNQIGVDFFWRETGSGYKIKSLKLGEDIDTSPIKDTDFPDISASIKGLNLYYIFNHKKFSYPAAYSQSTVQRRNAGSALLGIGYTRHSLKIDWQRLDDLIERKLGTDVTRLALDSTLLFGRIRYTDISVSGGYSYNWVFAHNWLFNASLSLAVGYKNTDADMKKEHSTFEEFDFKNFNLDGVTRLGIVWNNTKWYAGASAIFHTYNYRKSQFRTNSTFGNVNIYVGFNFDRR